MLNCFGMGMAESFHSFGVMMGDANTQIGYNNCIFNSLLLSLTKET